MAEVEVPDTEEIHERGVTAFGRRVALITAICAGALSVASLGGINTVKEMLLAQQQSSGQWAFYKARVIREHQDRGQKTLLETQLAEPSTVRGAERDKLAALGQKFADEENRYNAEKKDIEKDAKKLERTRVSILSASRPMFWFSLILALLGAGLTVNGFTQLVTLPFPHHH